MRIIVNSELVNKRAHTAQRALTTGVMLLVIALIASFYPRYVSLAYIIMLLATVLLVWATRTGNKWLGELRADKLLSKVLKGLDHRYRLYNYVLPAEHVLLAPAGLFVLLVKRQDGKVSYRGGKWHRQFNWRRIFGILSEEWLNDPCKQARIEAEKLHHFVATNLPDVDVPIQPVIVFVDPQVELDVVNPTVPAVTLGALKAYLRSAVGDKKLPNKTLEALVDLFDGQIS